MSVTHRAQPCTSCHGDSHPSFLGFLLSSVPERSPSRREGNRRGPLQHGCHGGPLGPFPPRRGPWQQVPRKVAEQPRPGPNRPTPATGAAGPRFWPYLGKHSAASLARPRHFAFLRFPFALSFASRPPPPRPGSFWLSHF